MEILSPNTSLHESSSTGSSDEDPVIQRIITAIQDVRSYLQRDGGDVEFARWEPETATCEVRLTGACKNCSMSSMTLRAGIERHLLRAVQEIRRVEQVR